MSSLARGFVFVRCCAGGRRCGVRPGACSEGSFAGVMIRSDCVSKCGYFFGQRRSICASAWSFWRISAEGPCIFPPGLIDVVNQKQFRCSAPNALDVELFCSGFRQSLLAAAHRHRRHPTVPICVTERVPFRWWYAAHR